MVKKKLREPLEDRKGILYFDGYSTVELAKEYDTPLYLLSEKRIRDNYDRLYGALVNNYKYVVETCIHCRFQRMRESEYKKAV